MSAQGTSVEEEVVAQYGVSEPEGGEKVVHSWVMKASIDEQPGVRCWSPCQVRKESPR